MHNMRTGWRNSDALDLHSESFFFGYNVDSSTCYTDVAAVFLIKPKQISGYALNYVKIVSSHILSNSLPYYSMLYTYTLKTQNTALRYKAHLPYRPRKVCEKDFRITGYFDLPQHNTVTSSSTVNRFEVLTES
jgi:hypothetical protein